MRKNRDLISALPLKDLRVKQPAIELPENFAKIHPPRFECGDRVRWIDVGGVADWGIITGKFYKCDRGVRAWVWYYVICLAASSKSAAWCQFDTAREDDLEVF
jgi:hypothetical protein